MKVQLIGDAAELGKHIDGIKASGAKLDKAIHIAACSALALLAAHNDTTFVNRTYLSMPAGSRKAALTSWFLAHGALAANADAKGKKEAPFVYTKDKATNVEAGMLDPWFNHKKDPAPDAVFDLQEAFSKLMERVAKAETDGKLKEGQETILARLRAINAVAEEPQG